MSKKLVMTIAEANAYIDDGFFNLTTGNYIMDAENNVISLNIEKAYDILKQIAEVETSLGITQLQIDLAVASDCMTYFESGADTYSNQMYSVFSEQVEELLSTIDQRQNSIKIEIEV